MSLSSAAYRQVDTIVSSWTSKYQYHISLLQSKQNMVKLMVEFSLTKPQKPIPVGAVRVYFTCTLSQNLNITFRFQKDSLIHQIGKTIRHQQIEKWIDDALEKKLLVRKTVFYLGTSYEETRVKDERLDKLLEEPLIDPKVQICHIDPELLKDQIRFIEIMERPKKNPQKMEMDLKLFFRQIDDENIGVVTREEFLKIIKNLGLKINEKEQEQILERVDQENTGTISYHTYREIVSQVLEAKEAKNQAEELIELQKEEEIFTTILSFINDDVQDIEVDILEQFKKKEEEEQEEDAGLTNISQIKSALEKVNKKMKQSKKNQLLTPLQMAEITKILTDLYGYKSIPYRNIHKHILDFKIKTFSSGLINSKMTSLELFIRNMCDEHDQKKVGKIKINELIQLFEKCEKIKLTQTQIYVLQSILPVNDRAEFSYIECSKFLSEVVKKFYLYSSKKKVEQ